MMIACRNSVDVTSLSSNITTDAVEFAGQGKNHGHRHRYRHRNRGMGTMAQPDQNIHISGDTVFIPDGSPVRSKLLLQKVISGTFSGGCTANGIVKPLPGHLAGVASPFEGRIVRSFVSLGQKVRAGTPLFEVSSSDYMEAVRTFMQAGNEKELAEKNYLRKKELMETGVGSRKEYEEAKLGFDLAIKEMEKTSAILRIFNIDPDEADLTMPLVIRAPISGEVVVTDITPGQYIKSDSEPIVTIAGLDKVRIVAHVREKEIGTISLNDHVSICTESFPNRPVKGMVKYIGNMMNEQSRTVEVYVECDNTERMLKPGMFVSVMFSRNIPDAIVIPAKSVLQENDRSILYIQAGENTFIKRSVTVTSADNERLFVTSGIENGSTVVTEGGIYLR